MNPVLNPPANPRRRVPADRFAVALPVLVAVLLLALVGCKDGTGSNNNGGGGPSQAVDDSYNAIEDRPITIGAPGVLGNDVDENGATAATVTPIVGGATTQGGMVTLNADGSFDYTPPTAFNGSDSFGYDYDDGDGFTDTAVVTITVADVAAGTVWHVDNTAAPGGDGLSQPTAFDNIADAEAASAAGDTIIVHTGDGTTTNLTAGIALKDLQRIEANGTPLLGGPVTLADNVQVDGLGFDSVGGSAAIVGTGLSGRADVTNVTVGSSAGAITVQTSTGRLVIDTLTTTGLTGTAISLQTNTDYPVTIIAPNIATASAAGLVASNGGTITLSGSGSISATGGPAISAQNSGLSGALASVSVTNAGGDGVLLATNTGALDLGTLTVSVSGTGLGITANGDVTVGSGSTIASSAGTALSVQDTNVTITLDGLSSAGASGNGVLLDTVSGSLTVNTAAVDIDDAGDIAVRVLDSSLTINFAAGLDILNGASSGLVLNNPTGAVTVAGTTINNTDGPGLVVTGAGTVNFGFGATSITNTGVAAGANGTGIVLVNNPNSVVTFDTLTVTTDNGTGLQVVDSGTVNIVATTASVTATGGPAADITTTSGQTNGSPGWTFATLQSSTSGTFGVSLATLTDDFTVTTTTVSTCASAGISLIGLSGTVNLGGGSITGAAGAAFDVNAGSADISWNGTITNSAGRLVRVRNTTGGSVALTGTSLADTGGTGVEIDLCNGTVAIDNASVTNPGDTAVSVTSSFDVTLTSLAVDTTAGARVGVFADGVNSLAINTGCTVDGGTGTAVDMRNSALACTFQRISSNGAISGISLENTTGSFTVAGTGAQDSGGIIQNSTQDGVLLTGAAGVSLNWLTIDSPANSGVIGVGVTDFALNDSRVLNAGNAGASDAVSFAAAADNIGGIVTISNTTIDGDFRDAIHIVKSTGTLSMTISGCRLQNSHAVNGRHGFHLEARGTASCDVTVNSSTLFSNLLGAGVRVLAEGSGQPLVKADNCTFQTSGGGFIVESDTTNATASVAGFTIATNTFNSLTGPALDIQSRQDGEIDGTFGGAAAADGNDVLNNSADGVRVRADGGSQSVVVAVTNNDITATTGQGIDVQASNSSRIDITITDNSNVTGGGASNGILVGSNTSGAICANIRDNTATGGGAETGIRAETNSSAFALERAPATPNATDIANHLESENTATASAAGSGFSAASDGECVTPTN